MSHCLYQLFEHVVAATLMTGRDFVNLVRMCLTQERGHPLLDYLLYLLLCSQLIEYVGVLLGHLNHLISELVLDHLVDLQLVLLADLLLHLRCQDVQARMLGHRLVVSFLRGGH